MELQIYLKENCIEFQHVHVLFSMPRGSAVCLCEHALPFPMGADNDRETEAGEEPWN